MVAYDISDNDATHDPRPASQHPPKVMLHAGWDTSLTDPQIPGTFGFHHGIRNYPDGPSTAKSAAPAWNKIAQKLPISRDAASTEHRRQLFDKFDVNSNGYLSLAEVDKAIRDVLQAPALFNSKPAVLRAFQAARRANGTHVGVRGDYVERSEFRLLLEYLKMYFELYGAFRRIDASDDRKIELKEWRRGVSMLGRWGVRLDPQEVDDEFRRIDVNQGGCILFDEFCDWAIARKLEVEGGPGAATMQSPMPSPRRGQSDPELLANLKVAPKAFSGRAATTVPRPMSAREEPGRLGWRGGGTSARSKSGHADPQMLAMRQQALDAVAAQAAVGFAKARPDTRPPPTALPKTDEAAQARRRAVSAVNSEAKAQLDRTLTLEAQSERAWSNHHRKASPAMTQVSKPPPKHVPSDADHRMGARSDRALSHDFGPPNFVLEGGRAPPQAFEIKGHAPLGPADGRMWRCKRCLTMQKPSSEFCVACVQPRSPALRKKSHALNKPAVWTPI